MGRRRIHRRDLPERMYCDRGVYYLWPKGAQKVWFRDADGRPLSLAAALAEYDKLVQRAVVVTTIADLIIEFERSAVFARYSERHQADRRVHHARLRAVFGHYEPHELGVPDLLEWKRARTQQAGRQWNAERSALAVLIDHAIDPLGLVEENVVRRVKPVPMQPRDRAPTNEELLAFGAICSEQQRLYMDLKLATGLRMGDLLKLSRSMILLDCLRVPVGKDRDRCIRFLYVDPQTGASTGVREILDAILALPRPVAATHLFATREGQPYTLSGWKALWQYRMRKFARMGGTRFHEHDIRATAGIVMETERGREAARELLGHRTQRTTAVYTERRRDRVVVPIKGKS